MDLMLLAQVIIFTLGTIVIAFVSRKSLRNYKHHGFYRFFVFEFTLALVLLNIPHWFKEPLSLPQIFSWILLFVSLFLLFESVAFLKRFGGHRERRSDSSNYKFENTTTLVKEGIYKRIRHPMYSSLLLLSFGTLLKNISLAAIMLSIVNVLFLILTAKAEEKEDVKFFGESYHEYVKETKMFIPFIF